jgi:hypothetical protein
MILVCSKCYSVYGCRPTYSYSENRMEIACTSCVVSEYCEATGKNITERVGGTSIEGFCADCIQEGGGL